MGELKEEETHSGIDSFQVPNLLYLSLAVYQKLNEYFQICSKFLKQESMALEFFPD
jgi:hypothetical protein